MNKKDSSARRLAASASASEAAPTTTAPKANRWNSGSKFNTILNNLEKTILNQFHSQQQTQVNRTKTCNQKAKQNAIQTSVRQKLNSLSSNLNTSTSQIKKVEHIKTSSYQQQQVQDDTTSASKATIASNDQKGFSNKVTLQSKNETSIKKRNTTLNKYQQQIVSTLRSSQNLLNNKLSIPPPHATNEARNENHRILFGSISQQTPNQSETTSDLINRNVTDAANTSKVPSRNSNGPIQIADYSLNETRMPPNLSPASSAKSLPNLALKSVGSQLNKLNECENDAKDSGFPTYRSRRSLLLNQPSQTNQPSPTSNISYELKSPSTQNMLQPNQQLMHSPSQPFSHIHNVDNTTSMTRMQPMFNTQTTSSNSNQVPIMLLDPNRGYINATSMSTVGENHQKFDQHNNYPHNVYNFYVPNRQSLTKNFIDPGQQIYANAPPKPRRYQYYDQNQMPMNQMYQAHNVMPNQVNGQPNGSARYFPQFQMSPYPINSQHMIQAKPLNDQSNFGQIVYNQHNFATNNSQLFPHEIQKKNLQPNRPNYQHSSHTQVSDPMQPVLIRSKSSLEACELLRYKSEKQLYSNNDQPPNYLQRYPSYSQSHHPHLNYRDSVHHGIGSSFNSNNLSRSKSVSHLAARPSDQATQNDLENRYSLTTDHKPMTVSSASTTNLNYIGLNPTNHLNSRINQTLVTQYSPNKQTQKNSVSQEKQTYPPSIFGSHQQRVASSPLNQSYTNSKGLAQSQHHRGDNMSLNNTSNNNHMIWQSQQNIGNSQATLPKLSLDDKIKSLLYDNDCGKHLIYPQSVDDSKPSQSTNAQHQDDSKRNPPSIGGIRQTDLMSGNVTNYTTQRNANLTVKSHIDAVNSADRIYMNDANSLNMGNRQPQQYYITVDNGSHKPPNITKSENIWHDRDTGSQLVVDLTTPRVLAKTQTILLPSNNVKTDFQASQRDTFAMNQLGLPNVGPQTNRQSSSPATSRQPVKPQNNDQVQSRTAPYYYSDLKSDEQRKALMSIVQKKSLSPPPQLLSRSIDQSSTRLASHTNLANKDTSRQQNNLYPLTGFTLERNFRHKTRELAEIDKNIDKLFDSDVKSKDLTHQSMLTLHPENRSSVAKNNPKLFDSNLVSTSLSSKSKSLEDIAQQNSQQIGYPLASVAKNPVYENIRRADKLMSAIDTSSSISTTCKASLRYQDSVLVNSSDGSIDSILSSSLGTSDASLDILDEMRIPSTDDHLSDICQLIEQLKVNHSKLSDDYRSTLDRITTTLARRNKQAADDIRSDKLTRKLEALERRSRKCELRSKNQLALIQMMEKVLKQPRPRSNISLSQNENDDIVDGKCNKQKTQARHQVEAISGNQQPNNESQSQVKPKAEGNFKNSSKNSVTRAIVTESDSPGKIETTKIGDPNKLGQMTNSRADNLLMCSQETKSTVLAKKESTRMHDDRSPDSDSDSLDDGDKSGVESTSSRSGKHSFNESGLDMMRDDEDFIEFLSSNGANGQRSKYAASQFDASQFSASDFNNSTSASESSSIGKELLSSPNSISETRGLSKQNRNTCSTQTKQNFQFNSKFESNNNDRNVSLGKDTEGKFNGILGNVVDVDVCSVNLSQC